MQSCSLSAGCAPVVVSHRPQLGNSQVASFGKIRVSVMRGFEPA